MDYRCLYGHRVPADFSFAIDNDACPRCGAQLVSLSGYQLARTLATGVPLEAVQAFATVRFLESNFTLTPKGDEAEEPSDEEESVGEIEIDESDEASEAPEAPVETEQEADAPAEARAELGAEPEETEEVPLDANTPVEEPIMPAPEAVGPTGPVAPIVLAEIPKKDEESLDDVEKAFFQ